MYEFCDANAIPYERCGKLIVAVRDDELPRLADLEARARERRPRLRRVGAAEIADIEPGCRGVAALHSPATGIVDFRRGGPRAGAELRSSGVTFALRLHGQRAAQGARADRHLPRRRPVPRAAAIACAGLWSDRLAVSAGGFPGSRASCPSAGPPISGWRPASRR